MITPALQSQRLSLQAMSIQPNMPATIATGRSTHSFHHTRDDRLQGSKNKLKKNQPDVPPLQAILQRDPSSKIY